MVNRLTLNLTIIHVLYITGFIVSGLSDVRDIKLVHEITIAENDSEDYYFGNIRDAAITNNGSVLLLDSSEKTVLVYSQKGDLITVLGEEGRGPGELLMPMSLASNPNGDILVADLGNAKISIWNNEFQLIREIRTPSPAGWYAHYRSFQTDGRNVFYWTLQPNPATGIDRVNIYKIDRESRETNLFYTINDADAEDRFEFITGWGSWDITSTGKIVVTGKTPDYSIYKFGIERDLMGSFGNPVSPITRTEEEIEQRIEAANRVSGQAVSLTAMANTEKPIFHNIQVDGENFVWAHRSKIYGAEENIDIYTLDGDFLTTVELPSGLDEYRLMDINENKALFKVMNENGEQSLKVYRIEYIYN